MKIGHARTIVLVALSICIASCSAIVAGPGTEGGDLDGPDAGPGIVDAGSDTSDAVGSADAFTGGSPAADAAPGVSYSLDVIVTSPQAGDATVMSSPSGITCGSTCFADFPAGTVVSLSVSGPGIQVCGWTGSVPAACQSAPECILTMDQDHLARPVLGGLCPQ